MHDLQTFATTLLLGKECSFPILTSSLHVTLADMQVITPSILLTLTNRKVWRQKGHSYQNLA